jgi:Flp pilus assembly pilin Flp
MLRFITDNTGAASVEYGLIAVLGAIALVSAMTAVGDALRTLFTNLAANFPSVP